MSKLCYLLIFTLFVTAASAQRLAQITIDNRGTSDMIAFLVDETVIVNLAKDGMIIDWGIENNTVRNNIYPGMLDKYMGKEEYFPATENSAYAGKVKYIGRTQFSYYTAADGDMLNGKVKTIGSLFLDYYKQYDDASFRGYLKSAGPISFAYYSSFENESYRGKIKTAGSTPVSYYGSTDDKAFSGKIKAIDRNLFTYYSSYDRREYRGMMKIGSRTVSAAGVKYVIKNY